MSPEPHLHVIEGTVSFDSSTGEVCSRCAALEANMALAVRDREAIERELRMKRRNIEDLEADKDRQAETHELADKARAIFWHWQIVCNKRNSPFTPDRFWQILPFLKNKKYGVDGCRKAIDGAAFESWVTQQRNGYIKWHVAWDKIFEKAGTVEDRINRAPKWWSPPASVELETWPVQRPTINDVKSFWGISPPKGWKPPATTTQSGQTALLGVVDE